MKKSLRHHQLESGQSLVEFSVLSILVLIILVGLLDLGRVYFLHIALEDGAGEAALYLSINPGCRNASDLPDPSNPTFCADPNNAEYRARTSSGGQLAWDEALIVVERPREYGVGDPIEVTIEYPFRFLLPLIPAISGVNPFPLRGHATQIILTEVTGEVQQ
ncbi:pilus assembly protein [Phototrophicus methaneseepsis]|uniref:Pilus assembly protein n=1 Tax=Phototrophicus methaneseepsis TaxID=2710758 RepID=A0A7S8ECS9_9CHLR|nr:TadE/TadG family type IV pilus assembly protein [Phototrophicus methaneseepsis]QPC84566.1 pilus assembly protein [Phototrophicus methaneseepsis]